MIDLSVHQFPPPDPADRVVLRRVLDRCAPGAVVVFDLDSTLLSNWPRQARILREFGARHGVPELERVTAAHFTQGFRIEEPMGAVGLSPARVEELVPVVRPFWRERFFTSEYCVEDLPNPGARDFVLEVRARGATVAYTTGRHEGMRDGTVATFRAHGFPLPDKDRVFLFMKASLTIPDDDFKRGAVEVLRTLGEVVGAFDNEPNHVNEYRRSFPEAQVVLLATDHSGRTRVLEPGIVAVGDFVVKVGDVER